MRKVVRTELQTRFLFAVVALLACSPLKSYGQGAPPDEAGRRHLSPGRFAPGFRYAWRKMGDRLQAAGKERFGFAGTLTDESGPRRIQLVWQLPGMFRFEETDRPGPLILRYNGVALNSSHGALARAETAIVESLVLDLPENLLNELALGAPARFLGGRFREDSAGNPGTLIDLYQVFPPPGGRRASGGDRVKLVAFDSLTLLPRSVRYSSAGVSVETSFSEWNVLNGQTYPRLIVRTENGSEVLRLEVTEFITGAPLPSAGFEP